LLALLVLGSSVSLGEEQKRSVLEEILRSHGIDPRPRGLAAFLAKGWEGANRPPVLPEAPRAKSSLTAEAWRLLALDYRELRAEPPLEVAVSSLAHRYATRDFPNQILDMIDEDLLAEDALGQERERADLLDLLQYNGMVALGILGRPSDDTLRAARQVYDAETRPTVRVSYAEALALLGDRSVVDDLVIEASKANATSSVAAARSLQVLFGRSFRLHSNMAVEPRREAAQEITEWWATARASAPPVDRDAALERRRRGRPAPQQPLDPLRAKLRASADVLDVTDARGSRTAWNQLQAQVEAQGAVLAEQLGLIVTNPREDLDVRAEAIRWFVRILGKKAKGTLKQLRKDSNPEIVDLVKKQLKDL
jgi:uncharacterized protein (DUF4415 family)